jgi:hypothetical protein
MMIIKDSIEAKPTPEKLFEWVTQRFKDKAPYQAWDYRISANFQRETGNGNKESAQRKKGADSG